MGGKGVGEICLEFQICPTTMYVTSSSVFHTEETVSIGLKNVLRVVTFILQNWMSML